VLHGLGRINISHTIIDDIHCMGIPLPVPGQRWVSDSEPELGLGVIVGVTSGRVEILFPAAGERRQYALGTAPLRRVLFKGGDRISTRDGAERLVDDAFERNGLMVYRTDAGEVREGDLSNTISFSSPESRLLAGHVDPLATYDLRLQALALRSRMQQSPVRGFVGGRIDLIPHQLSIAAEVASRLTPRVLLADEVGLGKTIEAGMILHRLHLTGRADRVLILVPEPLVHQWFVELLRRFNLSFSIYDEERCASIEEHEREANPFLDTQLVLCGIDLLAKSPRRASQALDAGWDLLIVDEAHHLEWSPSHASAGYRLVEALAARTPGLLLLTATPQQLGPEGHFARLRLLDPDRYADLGRFLEEADHYELVARAVERVIAGEPLSERDVAFFGAASERVRRDAARLAAGDEAARELLVSDLLDSFGTGRVMFRNTRAALEGFPERRALLTPIDITVPDELVAKVAWLARTLRELRDEKVLLICRTRALAETIQARLQHEISVNAALFHEGLTLVQRDRNATYFAEPDGARILICSEIGSEGRNFQFVHHLVLFDLPDDPELLEQRIGRLDRIGQRETVRIHVPYVEGTSSEALARWYHEGLDAFEQNLHGAAEIAAALRDDLDAALADPSRERIERLIAHSRDERARVEGKLEHGYDRLLQLNSNRPGLSDEMAREIRAADADRSFETFVVRLLEYFGVVVDDLEHRRYVLRPGHLLTDAFPALPDDGMAVTFDRATANAREDLAFMTWDHPFVRSVMELLLEGEAGNAAFGVLRRGEDEGLLLELCAIVECVAPPALRVDRFLPPHPVRVVVDDEGAEVTDQTPRASSSMRNGDVARVLERGVVVRTILPDMLDTAHAIAEREMEAIVARARETAHRQLSREIERLDELRQVNDNVRGDEVAALVRHRDALESAIEGARLRVGALRLIRTIAAE
jgi:ATP-dependent helicase HepA